jgi:hypothetical protein
LVRREVLSNQLALRLAPLYVKLDRASDLLAGVTRWGKALGSQRLDRFLEIVLPQLASVDALTKLLRQHHHPTPEATAQALWDRLHQPQLQADAITTRTKSRLTLALVSQLTPLLAQIAQYDAEISRLFREHPDSVIFTSLPRAGKRLASRLLAGWGDDRERYASAANVQALAGTSPVTYESGNYARAHRRYACIKPFRNTLYQFAWQTTFQEPWAATYYRHKRQEGKSHSMAVRALANVLGTYHPGDVAETPPVCGKPSWPHSTRMPSEPPNTRVKTENGGVYTNLALLSRERALLLPAGYVPA